MCSFRCISLKISQELATFRSRRSTRTKSFFESPFLHKGLSPSLSAVKNNFSVPFLKPNCSVATSNLSDMSIEGARRVETEIPELLAHLFDNGVAVLTLNRPKALNAMNLDMDIAYKKLLDAWETSSEVKAVIIEGATPRAFSSGADVKWMTTTGREKYDPVNLAQKVFQAEYSLICKISRFSKPYLSLMDGITMGFGIGLSGHGKYRIVTEKTLLAMPENKIGLFPDVGFAHLVSRNREKAAIGAYLGLTGGRISNPKDSLLLGIASHFVPSQKLPELRSALISSNLGSEPESKIEDLLEIFSEIPKGQSDLEDLLPHILDVFGTDSNLDQIFSRLADLKDSKDEKISNWAKDSLTAMSAMSPFSLQVTRQHFRQVALANNESTLKSELSEIEGVMRQEYRLAVQLTLKPDFVEGVRAVLVDKDQNPKWIPNSLDDVAPADVAAIFEPLGENIAELAV